MIRKLKALMFPTASAEPTPASPVAEAAPVPATDLPAASDPVPLHEDGAPEDGPVVYVRDSAGTLVRCRAVFARAFSFSIDGRQCAHVDTAPDGVWIYEVRSY